MNNSIKTNSPSPCGFKLDCNLPVLSNIKIAKKEYYGTVHTHPRGQLICPCKGLVKAKTKSGLWLVPPSQSLWVPPMTEHQILLPKSVSVTFLFVDPTVKLDFTKNCCVLAMNNFMHELINKSVHIGNNYTVNSPEFRIMLVIIDELKKLPPTPLNLPFAKDERLTRVMNFLMKQPNSQKKMESFASLACTSSKNLNRLFVKETGLTYGNWRKQLIVLESIEKLNKGSSVTEVAIDMWYNSISAFITMFKKVTGKTPGEIALNFEKTE
ncbi:MAG TPA: helix-turn-helix transcriptional regulator [Victivallales bacterium]|nr:helix-turn-helix transcriptional regulator [Victivallales bacterium]